MTPLNLLLLNLEPAAAACEGGWLDGEGSGKAEGGSREQGGGGARGRGVRRRHLRLEERREHAVVGELHEHLEVGVERVLVLVEPARHRVRHRAGEVRDREALRLGLALDQRERRHLERRVALRPPWRGNHGGR